jgi:hypothetical protein
MVANGMTTTRAAQGAQPILHPSSVLGLLTGVSSPAIDARFGRPPKRPRGRSTGSPAVAEDWVSAA